MHFLTIINNVNIILINHTRNNANNIVAFYNSLIDNLSEYSLVRFIFEFLICRTVT